MQWVDAKQVLPHEAHDFTPWLSDNLDLLADTLGLDELELVATEWKVETFALDVLARGLDAGGEVTVVIENQYGDTDHRHLGQILTYAAHAAAGGRRVLAVWLTEHVRPAHLAAVEFLNRIAAEGSTFGLVLLRVRFAPAPAGWHVHFEVDAGPNAFLSVNAPSDASASSSKATSRGNFITEVVAELDPLLQPSGILRQGGINTKHGAAVYKLPSSSEVASLLTARVVCSQNFVNVALYIEKFPEARSNWAMAELLRLTYSNLIQKYDLRVDQWHGSGVSIKRERVITQIDSGYDDREPSSVAAEAARIFQSWAHMLAEHPMTDVEDRVNDLAQSWGAESESEAE